jgi:hypothetical protein
MWRSVKVDGILSDVANLSWSKDAVLAQAARDVVGRELFDFRPIEGQPLRLELSGIWTASAAAIEAGDGSCNRRRPARR